MRNGFTWFKMESSGALLALRSTPYLHNSFIQDYIFILLPYILFLFHLISCNFILFHFCFVLFALIYLAFFTCSSLNPLSLYLFPLFLISIMGGGVQLGPLCTTATNRHIVHVPSDYDDGEICGIMIWQGKIKCLEKICPSAA
jgi:hypothetical protein